MAKELSQYDANRIPVLVSGCLLGQQVRFDGGHKLDRFVAEGLSSAFEFVAVCPELAMGLGSPRAALRLVRDGDRTKLTESKNTAADYTARAEETAARLLEKLPRVYGAILKKDSPSCGPFKVKVYSESGMADRNGAGFFASALRAADPLLPMEDEGRLNDAGLREAFIERVYAYRRWVALVEEGLSVAKLMAFHRDHKFMIMSRPRSDYAKLGRIVAGLTKSNLAQQSQLYVAALMEVLARAPSRAARANMMYHLLGYLKQALGRDDKKALVDVLETYRTGALPFAVPMVLLADYFRRFPDPYVMQQYCLMRYPMALGMHTSNA